MSIRGSVLALSLALLNLAACDRAEPRAGAAEAEVAPQGAELDPALEVHLPAGATFDEARLGHRLFTPCTVCHGPEGEGTQLGPSFRDGAWIHVEPEAGQIASLIRDGVSRPREYPVPMPVGGGGEFDEAELRALAVYVLLMANQGEAR
jgi:mono/diheme cytochrome c family protein